MEYTRVKNWPKRIFLQPGPIDDAKSCIDFGLLSDEHITWCTDRQNSNDAEYNLEEDWIKINDERTNLPIESEKVWVAFMVGSIDAKIEIRISALLPVKGLKFSGEMDWVTDTHWKHIKTPNPPKQ